MPPVFEDLAPANGRAQFSVCNESIATWRKALDGISVDNAASICSAGEISFFSILPVVKKQLLLVDNSYCPMFYAIGKYHIIEKLGAREAHKLFTAGNIVRSADVTKLVTEGNEGLPTGKALSEKSYYYRELLYGNDLKRAYKHVSQADIAAFRLSRKKLRFLHADMNVLVERGPFDLVYLSNAMDYGGTRYGFNHDEFKKSVKPGGYILYTSSHDYYYDDLKEDRHAKKFGFKVIFSESKRATRDESDASIDWKYVVLQAPE
jgi:hypothetical protein